MVHRPVLDFAVNFGFSQLVDFNTRGDNLLDIILTDDSMLIAKVGALPPIGHSDHLVVEFTVSVNLQVNSTSNNPSADDVRYQWYRADFDSLSIYVDATDWMTAVYHDRNARNMWTFFMNTLNDGIKLFVQSYKLCDNFSN